ncbi:hypothetical protein ACO1O0_007710 [Amphichorda felina]
MTAKAACTVCHRRKVRCDADQVGTPCTNCSKVSVRRDSCRIHQKHRRTPRRPRSPKPEADRRLSGFPGEIPGEVPGLSGPSGLSRDPSRLPADDDACHGYSMLDASADSEHQYKRHLVEFVDQPHIEERPIDKHSRTVYIGSEVANLHHLASQHFGQRTSRVSHYPTNRLPRRQACHEPDRLPVDALELPPRAVVDRLLHAYFEHVNPGFPVVDERLFLQQYHARDPRNPPSLLLLHAMLVVGAHVLHDDDSKGQQQQQQQQQQQRTASKAVFFRRAKALFDARFERNRDTVVQAALLLSWHADGPEDVAANAWFWVGVAMRTATGLGMHRDADASTVVAHNKRMWRRVWWLLFRCDVLLALQYGRPRSVRLEDCDVKPLREDDFVDCGLGTQVEYVTHAVGLAVIVSRILEARFSLASSPYGGASSTTKDPRRTVRELNQALARWSLELPEGLGSRSGRCLSLWPAYLQLQYNTVLILLHRASPPWQPQARPDGDVCSVAAGCVVSLLQAISDRGGLRSLWISAVNAIFTALIQLDVQVRASRASPVLAVPALMHYDNTVAVLRRFAEYWPNALPILHFFEQLRAGHGGGSGGMGDDGRLGVVETQGARPYTPSHVPLMRSVGSMTNTPPNIGSSVGGGFQAGTAGMGSAQNIQNSMAEQDFHDAIEPSPSTEGQAVADMAEAWQEWRSSHWQHIDIMDEFPFIF